jgi:hypothetical protein
MFIIPRIEFEFTSMVEPPTKRARMDDPMDDGDDWCWDDLSEDATLLVGLFVPKTDLVWFRDMDRWSAQSVQSYREPYWNGDLSALSTKTCSQSIARFGRLGHPLPNFATKYVLRANAWSEMAGCFGASFRDRLQAAAFRGESLMDVPNAPLDLLDRDEAGKVAMNAVKSGNLVALKQVPEYRTRCMYGTLEDQAARYGHWHIVMFLFEDKEYRFSDVHVRSGAMRGGQFPFLKRLFEKFDIIPRYAKCKSRSSRPTINMAIDKWRSSITARSEHIIEGGSRFFGQSFRLIGRGELGNVRNAVIPYDGSASLDDWDEASRSIINFFTMDDGEEEGEDEEE